YNLFPGTEDRMVILPWYDGLYVTKPHGKLIKIQHKTFKEIPKGPYAKYGIVANSHLYFANTGTNVSRSFTRVRWSDLDGPDLWDLDPESSEADFFDIEPP